MARPPKSSSLGAAYGAWASSVWKMPARHLRRSCNGCWWRLLLAETFIVSRELDPRTFMHVPLRNKDGMFAKVSPDDFENVNKITWHVHSNTGYIYGRLSKTRTSVSLHRYIMELAGIEPPSEDAQNVDHANGNRLDNRRENLAWVTTRENAMNKHTKNTSTGFRCVYFSKERNNYYVVVSGTRYGTYSTPEEAASIVNAIFVRMGEKAPNPSVSIATQLPDVMRQTRKQQHVPRAPPQSRRSENGITYITTKGGEVMMSDEDARDFPWSIHIMGTGYPQGLSVLLHRWVAERMGILGDDTKVIDHVDHNKLNATRSNLRAVTRKENAHNRTKSGEQSKYVGIYRNGKKWWAVKVSGRYGGNFATEEAAARRADELAIEIYGSQANLNFPNSSPGEGATQ